MAPVKANLAPPGFGPAEDTPAGFGPAEDIPAGFGAGEDSSVGGRTPSGQPMSPLPVPPRDFMGTVAAVPSFLKGLKTAAGHDLEAAWTGAKDTAKETGKALSEDPTRIVPLWFGGLMKGGEAAAKTVATPVEYVFQGDIPAAVSSAAGGDPAAAEKYRNDGDAGGEFWEMLGKPLAMIATGEAAGRVGGRIAEGAEQSRLRVVRGVMADAGPMRTGADMSEAQLAQQALQDAARDAYGTGPAGFSKMSKKLPSRDRGLTDLLSGNPATKSRIEAGNKELIGLSRKAVELAGQPADQVNAVFGYLDGRQAAKNIQSTLLQQAADAEGKGLKSYGKALRERASALDNKKTLGQIYDVKKSANKLADVARNTQEGIDLMDSWSALASAVRHEVYPIYDSHIDNVSMPGFSLSEAGRKEGAAMQFRNGLEKRWGKAQQMSDELHIPGHTTKMASSGASEHRTLFSAAARKAQELGLLGSEQGALNKAGKKAIGPLSPDTVPEHLQVTSAAKFGPAPPPTQKLLPGRQFTFRIQGNPATAGTEGQIAHSAEKVTGRHSFQDPAYTTSSAPNRTELGSERTHGGDVQTATPPGAQTDVAKGPGVLETNDPEIARQTLAQLEKMANSTRYGSMTYGEKVHLRRAIEDLRGQLADYEKGQGKAKISHTPPSMKYTPRKTGKLPVGHPVRSAAPAFVSDYERERDQEQ